MYESRKSMIIRNKFVRIFFAVVCLLFAGYGKSSAVSVTLLIDETTPRPLALGTAERNLGVVLSEINRAQSAKTILTTSGLPMDDFSLKSLLRIWAVTPFRCDDDEVVERLRTAR